MLCLHVGCNKEFTSTVARISRGNWSSILRSNLYSLPANEMVSLAESLNTVHPKSVTERKGLHSCNARTLKP